MKIVYIFHRGTGFEIEFYFGFGTGPTVDTIADGVAVKTPGDQVFPYIQENLDDIITIEDNELVSAFLDMTETHKMSVENAGLLTVAALYHLDCKNQNVVPILTDGNMDIITMSSLIQNGLINRGRVFTFSVQLPDRPGELLQVRTDGADTAARAPSRRCNGLCRTSRTDRGSWRR